MEHKQRLLTEEKIKEIRNAFDEVISPQCCEWHFKEYGLKLNYDEVMGAIKTLDTILEDPNRYQAIAGVFMVRNNDDDNEEHEEKKGDKQ